MTTRGRREARADRLREWAGKRQSAAAAVLQSHEVYRGDHAFNFQPGHIPQRARVIAQADRAFESMQKADGMAARADGITAQLDRAIYSDDENAVEALRARIAGLEAGRDRIKAYNATCRKGTPDESLLDDGQRREIASMLRMGSWATGKGGAFPSYANTNTGANIRRLKERVTDIERRNARTARAEDNGGVVVEGTGDYVRVTFAEKPERDTLDALRSAGFRWGSGSWCGRRDALPVEVTA